MNHTLGLLLTTILCISAARGDDTVLVLKPARIFDGKSTTVHEGWIVIVRGEKIASVGPANEITVPNGAKIIDLPGATLLPGLIDAHSHLLLHPYDETKWD